MRLLVTRPEPDAGRLAARLEDMGYGVVRAPVLHIRHSAVMPDLEGVQALAFTSANGVRALAALTAARDVPVFAVGESTAEAARAAAFTDVRVAGGDVNALAALIAAHLDPRGGPVLHASGSHVAGDLAGRLSGAGFRVRREMLYEARAAQSLPAMALRALNGEEGPLNGALFYSPRTAELFEKLTAKANLSGRLASLTAYCLSPAVAGALTQHFWARLAVAAAPDQTSLLALLPPPGTEAGRTRFAGS